MTRNWVCNEPLVIQNDKQLTLWPCVEPVQLAVTFNITLTLGCCINHFVSHWFLVSCFYTLKPSLLREFIPNLICKTWTRSASFTFHNPPEFCRVVLNGVDVSQYVTWSLWWEHTLLPVLFDLTDISSLMLQGLRCLLAETKTLIS